MSLTYEKAPKGVIDLIKWVVNEHHERLNDYPFEVGAVMAYSDTDKPAVKLHGHSCAATIKLTTVKQRRAVEGTPAAIITIDGNRWEFLTKQQQIALLDHGLTHLRYVEKDGDVKLAEDGQPKLKMRLDDWALTGFAEVVERHGSNAIEAMALKDLRDRHGQLLLWAEDPKAAG